VHGLDIARHAPKNYNDPCFFDKMMAVGLIFAGMIVFHRIRKAEDELKSTHS